MQLRLMDGARPHMCPGLRKAEASVTLARNFDIIDVRLSNFGQSGINDLAIFTDYHHSCMASYVRKWSLANNMRAPSVSDPRTGLGSGTVDALFQSLMNSDITTARRL